MKKEYLLAITIGFFVLAQVLDYLAGPIYFTLSSPYDFLNRLYLNQYPLTAVAIGLRSLAIFFSTILLFSLFEKSYLVKAIILFVVSALAQLYAIQQVRTGMRTTSIQLTLSICYGTLLYILPIILNIFQGLIDTAKQKISSLEEADSDEKST